MWTKEKVAEFKQDFEAGETKEALMEKYNIKHSAGVKYWIDVCKNDKASSKRKGSSEPNFDLPKGIDKEGVLEKLTLGWTIKHISEFYRGTDFVSSPMCLSKFAKENGFPVRKGAPTLETRTLFPTEKFKDKLQKNEMIKELYFDEGLTLREIGKVLGITYQAVHIRIKDMGLKARSLQESAVLRTARQKPSR